MAMTNQLSSVVIQFDDEEVAVDSADARNVSVAKVDYDLKF